MQKFQLITREGREIELNKSMLDQIHYNTSLATNLFGAPVPKDMGKSRAMAWADAHYRDQMRQLQNYRMVFQEAMSRYEADESVKGLYDGYKTE